MQEQLFPIPQGKLISEAYQAYCSIEVGEEKEGSAYCFRNCKLKLETIVKKILEMRELFHKTSKEKVKRLHLPTGESPLAKKVCVNKDSEQSAPVAKRGLVFAASRGENVTRNINAVKEKVAHNPTTELRNINLQENSIPSINKQFSQWNGPSLPRQLFPFYSIFQPPLTVVPIVNFSRPVNCSNFVAIDRVQYRTYRKETNTCVLAKFWCKITYGDR